MGPVVNTAVVLVLLSITGIVCGIDCIKKAMRR